MASPNSHRLNFVDKRPCPACGDSNKIEVNLEGKVLAQDWEEGYRLGVECSCGKKYQLDLWVKWKFNGMHTAALHDVKEEGNDSEQGEERT